MIPVHHSGGPLGLTRTLTLTLTPGMADLRNGGPRNRGRHDSDKVQGRWTEYIDDLYDKNNKPQEEDMHLETDTERLC